MKPFVLCVILLCCADLLVSCSEHCNCRVDTNKVIIGLDCSNRDLIQLPELDDLYEANITHLDLSGNRLSVLPQLSAEYTFLSHINLSRNDIDLISFPTIMSIKELRQLDLSWNSIDSGKQLPQLFETFDTLVSVNLSANPLKSIPNYLENKNLKILDLNYCHITMFHGPEIIQGFPRLEKLSLRGNPLRTVSDIASSSLIDLDLSYCKLGHLQANIVAYLPNLIHLNLAQNPRLSLTQRSGEIVHSESLKVLDLSYCNMDSIETSGFPNLTSLNLRGNLIKSLLHSDFANNAGLENIDVSLNAIAFIAPDAFHGVTMLKHLDISFNMIRSIPTHTFVRNTQLTSINLSRNFLAAFSRISSGSITHLNISWCEVLTMDEDALSDLPELVDLDLSYNLLSEFPSVLRAEKLQRLDLRMCRISTIRNSTFDGFPRLTQLQLSSNRFTTPFRVQFFENNYFLREIHLGDNPWRCECSDTEFYQFYMFINEEPMMVRTELHTFCNKVLNDAELVFEYLANYCFAQNYILSSIIEHLMVMKAIETLVFNNIGFDMLLSLRTVLNGLKRLQ